MSAETFGRYKTRAETRIDMRERLTLRKKARSEKKHLEIRRG